MLNDKFINVCLVIRSPMKEIVLRVFNTTTDEW